jgi:hypothetical protein
MSPEYLTFERTVREFITGVNSWESLAEVGVAIQWSEGSVALSNPSERRVEASLEEVAIGFLRLEKRFQDLRAWATILLSSSVLIDLDQRFETDPRGDVLLGGIWDAAFGERPAHRVVAIAREVAGSLATRRPAPEYPFGN